MDRHIFINAEKTMRGCIYAISSLGENGLTGVSGIFRLNSVKKACLFAADASELKDVTDKVSKRIYHFASPDIAEYVAEFRNYEVSMEDPDPRLIENNKMLIKTHTSKPPLINGISKEDFHL